MSHRRRPERAAGGLRLLLATAALAGRSSLPLLVAATALSFAGGVVEPAVAWLLKSVIDGVAGTGPAPRWSPATLAVLIALVMGVGAVLPRFNEYLSRALSRRLTRRVHERLFTSVSRLQGLALLERPAFHDRLMLACAAGVTAPQAMVGVILGLVTGVATLVGFTASLLAIAPLLAAMAVVSAAPSLLGQALLTRSYVGAAQRMAPHERRQSFFADLLTDVRAAKEIRLFGLARFFLARMLAELDRTHHHERRVDRLTLSTGAGLGFFSAGCTGAAIIYAVSLVTAGRVTVGSLALLLAAFNAVQVGLTGVVEQIGSVQRVLALMRHYDHVTSHPPDLPPPPGGYRPVAPLRRGIELRDVWFRYDERHPWVLKSVSARLPAAEATALVGLNGAGKSTLVKLLCRLYDPQRGAILWDGVDLRELDPAELRRRISGIFQDFLTYDLTVAENLALGDLAADPPRSRLVEAATAVGLHATLSRLPNGYDTMLSRTFADGQENGAGVMLSGGQSQRLAIARALLRREADLMIMDEPSAALDAETEHELHELLRAARGARTSLLITHRLNTVRGADNIVVLVDGRVHEQGGHAALMAADGEYARLFRLQAEAYQLS